MPPEGQNPAPKPMPCIGKQLKSRHLSQWIANFLDRHPTRANSLIITVYGDFIAPHGGTVWLGSFIRLMEPLGLNERMVRTSVYRLSQEKWLVSAGAASSRPIGASISPPRTPGAENGSWC